VGVRKEGIRERKRESINKLQRKIAEREREREKKSEYGDYLWRSES